MASQYIDPPHYSRPEILEEAQYAELVLFLTADIPVNLFQLSWLENHGIHPPQESRTYVYLGVRDRLGKLAAAALGVGQSLALIHSTTTGAAQALGRWFRRHDFQLDHIVSSRQSVDPFWRAYAAGDATKPLKAQFRRAQSLYTFERERWDTSQPHCACTGREIRPRRASLDELDAVFLASARMHREDTHLDPLRTDPGAFRRHVAHRIRRGRCYVYFDAHQRLVFKADISAFSSFGVQLSGVYTDPIYRQQGIATGALFDICNQLFEGGSRRVTLYVNDDNQAAHHVYRKVGFEFHAPYQTIFV